MSAGWRTSAWTAAVVAVVLLAPVALDPPLVILDPEEGHTPWMAGFFAGLDPVAATRLQPNAYCHGCSVDAWLTAGLLTFAPRVVLTWRIVSALYLAALAAGGFRLLRALVGPGAGWCWVGLLVLAPHALADQLWTSWGGHVQGVALALLAASVGVGHDDARRWGIAGLGLAGAVVYTLGALPVVAGVGAWLVGRRAWRALAGLGAGLLAVVPGLALAWWVHPGAWHALRQHMRTYDDGLGVLGVLGGLVRPDTLALLVGPEGPVLGAGLGGLVAVAGVVAVAQGARRPRAEGLFTAIGAAWLIAYLASSIHVDPITGEVREARFAVLGVVVLQLHLAAVAGRWARRPGRRGWALALVAPWVLGGLVDRVQRLPTVASPRTLVTQRLEDLSEVLLDLPVRHRTTLDAARCEAGVDLCDRWRQARAGFEAWDPATAAAMLPPEGTTAWQAGWLVAPRYHCGVVQQTDRPAGCARLPRWYLGALGRRYRMPDRDVPRAWARHDPDLPEASEVRRRQRRLVGRGLGALYGPMAPPPPCGAPPDEVAAYAEGLRAGLPERWMVDVGATVDAILASCDP